MVKEITIRNQEQAEQINRVVSHAPYEVWMSTDTTMIDARSLLGAVRPGGQEGSRGG